MNTYSRALPLPSAMRPVRERGSSALDRVAVAWPAPNAAARIADVWGPPQGMAVVLAGGAPWPAPAAALRFDLPVATVLASPRCDLIEPAHPVPVPDLLTVSKRAVRSFAPPVVPRASQVTVIDPVGPAFPAPTLADAAPVAARPHDRSGISARLVVGLAAAAAAISVGAAVVLSIL